MNSKTSLDDTLETRGKQYGKYVDVAQIAQMIKFYLQQGCRWPHMDLCEKESMDLIATKLARLVCLPMSSTEVPLLDSWHDIQGYAKLAEDHLRSLPVG